MSYMDLQLDVLVVVGIEFDYVALQFVFTGDIAIPRDLGLARCCVCFVLWWYGPSCCDEDAAMELAQPTARSCQRSASS